MTKLIIVCAGGFGREIFQVLARCQTDEGRQPVVLGFLDDNPNALKHVADKYPPILGPVDGYWPKPDERLILAVGTPSARRKISRLLERKSCGFMTVVHPLSSISGNVSLGEGSFVGWNVGISCDVTVGRFAAFNANLTVGHDTVIDDYVEVGPGTAIGGCCHIEEGVHVAPNCMIAPGIRLGAWSKISACTAVMRDVPPCSYVVGVPGVVHRDFFSLPDKE